MFKFNGIANSFNGVNAALNFLVNDYWYHITDDGDINYALRFDMSTKTCDKFNSIGNIVDSGKWSVAKTSAIEINLLLSQSDNFVINFIDDKYLVVDSLRLRDKIMFMSQTFHSNMAKEY